MTSDLLTAFSSCLTQFSIPLMSLQLRRELTNPLLTAVTPFDFVIRQDDLWKAL